MRLAAWQVVAALLVALALIAIPVANMTGPRSCDGADDSLSHGLFGDAEKAYTTILDDEPESDCARQGMIAVAHERCFRTQRLTEAGYTEQATKEYETLLAMEPRRGIFGNCKLPPAVLATPGGTTTVIQGPPGPPGDLGPR